MVEQTKQIKEVKTTSTGYDVQLKGISSDVMAKFQAKYRSKGLKLSEAASEALKNWSN